jgi:hypothetical protein
MKPRFFLLSLLFLWATACETTPDPDDPLEEGEEVTIPADDLEPMTRFVLSNRRLMVAEYVRIEVTPQFFEQRMGFTRDPRYVERTSWRDDEGRRIVQIKNANSVQKTNIDPDMLPRVYFGNGLELRAYKVIRIIFVNPKNRQRPLYIHVEGKNATGDAKVWVSGRLQHKGPTVKIQSELLWSEKRERYVMKSHVG